MFNVGGSIIGLHDPNSHKIHFNAAFIGRMNVSFAYKKDGGSDTLWFVTVDKHGVNTGASGSFSSDAASIDNNGVLTYNPTILEDPTQTDRPYFSMFKVNCRAYDASNDAYEEITFWFRYGQIAITG